MFLELPFPSPFSGPSLRLCALSGGSSLGAKLGIGWDCTGQPRRRRRGHSWAGRGRGFPAGSRAGRPSPRRALRLALPDVRPGGAGSIGTSRPGRRGPRFAPAAPRPRRGAPPLPTSARGAPRRLPPSPGCETGPGGPAARSSSHGLEARARALPASPTGPRPRRPTQQSCARCGRVCGGD